MKKVLVFDYGVGNIMSLKSTLARVFSQVEIVSSVDEVSRLNFEYLVLPGVGAAQSAMKKLPINEVQDLLNKNPRLKVLGICLGMQLLMKSSQEGPGVETLGIFQGITKKIPTSSNGNSPRIGWFPVYKNFQDQSSSISILQDVPNNSYFYFAHSFSVASIEARFVDSITDYGIISSITNGRIFGVQFHPEKSGDLGLRVLNNFANVE
jgi:glutamine amidotransferase